MASATIKQTKIDLSFPMDVKQEAYEADIWFIFGLILQNATNIKGPTRKTDLGST